MDAWVMLIGDLIYNQSGTHVYTEPMLREASSAEFFVEVIQVTSNVGNLLVTVQHRNVIDDAWTTATTFAVINAVGDYRAIATSLRELIRLDLELRFKIGSIKEWMRVDVPAPLWDA